MRTYVGVSIEELEALLASTSISIPTLFAATTEFVATHSELGEEEHEFILSMLAAEESLELREGEQGYVLVDAPIALEWVPCIFLVSPDGEDLTWFAIQEVASLLPGWRK